MPLHSGDPFNDTRQRFHDLRGRLSVITSCIDLMRHDPVTPDQEAALQRMDATVSDLADALQAARDAILKALVLPPRAGLIWVAECLDTDGHINQDVLAEQFDHMRRYHGLPAIEKVVIVADSDRLPTIRAAFQGLHCHARVATDPADVSFLLDEKPADLVAMAPTTAQSALWWNTLRLLMQGVERPPLMLQLAREGS